MLHSLRAKHTGVLIGINTLFADQPQLNVRDQLEGCEEPFPSTRPIVLDTHLRILQINPAEIRITRPIICCCLTSKSSRFLLAQSKVSEIGGSILSCSSDDCGRYRVTLTMRVCLYELLFRVDKRCMQKVEICPQHSIHTGGGRCSDHSKCTGKPTVSPSHHNLKIYTFRWIQVNGASAAFSTLPALCYRRASGF